MIDRGVYMRKRIKRIFCLVLSFIMIFGSVFAGESINAEAGAYSAFYIYLSQTELTLYTGDVSGNKSVFLSIRAGASGNVENFDEKINNIWGSINWTTSDKDVIAFLKEDTDEKVGSLEGTSLCHLVVVGEGTATIKAYSSILKKTLKCKVTVEKAGITCDKFVFYTNNEYSFKLEGATAASFSSSNEELASIDENTGILTTKKTGKVTISCTDTEGNTYKKKIEIKKAGLMYEKLTSYYFTGMMKGYYSSFPLIAMGIDVKKWTSSNKKVVKVNKIGSHIGKLEIHGTGKCTITCESKSGKKYKCKVTIVGGKKWSGLSGG